MTLKEFDRLPTRTRVRREEQLLSVAVASVEVGLAGLSLMREGVFTPESERYARHALRFLDIMAKHLSTCSGDNPDAEASYVQEVQRSFYNSKGIFKNIGLDLRYTSSFRQMRQSVLEAAAHLNALLQGQPDQPLAAALWPQLNEWADWYFMAMHNVTTQTISAT